MLLHRSAHRLVFRYSQQRGGTVAKKKKRLEDLGIIVGITTEPRSKLSECPDAAGPRTARREELPPRQAQQFVFVGILLCIAQISSVHLFQVWRGEQPGEHLLPNAIGKRQPQRLFVAETLVERG